MALCNADKRAGESTPLTRPAHRPRFGSRPVGVDVYGQVWDDVEGDIVWEGVGAARATPGEFTYVKDQSIDTRPSRNQTCDQGRCNCRKVNSFNNMSCNVKVRFRIMQRQPELPSRRNTNASEQAMPIRKTRHKAELEAWLYLANRVKRPTLHKLSKLLYFADKFHLEHYGRLVTGDSYIAMKNGPVPSTAYDQAKRVRDEGESVVDGAYGVHENKDVVPRRDADLQFLSETDVEALDHALEKYGHLDFAQLTHASHDDSWKATTQNLPISWDDFTLGMRDREAIVEFLGA